MKKKVLVVDVSEGNFKVWKVVLGRVFPELEVINESTVHGVEVRMRDNLLAVIFGGSIYSNDSKTLKTKTSNLARKFKEVSPNLLTIASSGSLMDTDSLMSDGKCDLRYGKPVMPEEFKEICVKLREILDKM